MNLLQLCLLPGLNIIQEFAPVMFTTWSQYNTVMFTTWSQYNAVMFTTWSQYNTGSLKPNPSLVLQHLRSDLLEHSHVGFHLSLPTW